MGHRRSCEGDELLSYKIYNYYNLMIENIYMFYPSIYDIQKIVSIQEHLHPKKELVSNNL